ncbi:MAG: hypothetical protein KC800_31090, partial [Candidatus Eremiobacteraeota bacterium]|nr:hypothetical protein [Candidatus Eremiobacteraeota bacterium]
GEEETRLRSLDSQGNEKWSRPGRADWMTSGAHLTVVRGSTLTGIESETGGEMWVRQLTGSLAPLDLSGHQLRLSESGCRLHTLNTETGEISDTVSSGHTFFVNPNGRVSDHDGQIWRDPLPADRSAFVGEWKEVEPFHIGMKAAPTSRLERQAVFVDWDGDEKDDGSDPVLLDDKREIVSWAQLRGRDTDSDRRLDTRELSGLNLWFDSDGDGKVSSDAEFRPLLSSSFDKGRIELASELLWLASDSSCGA